MSVCTLFYDTVYMCNAVTAAQKLVLTLCESFTMKPDPNILPLPATVSEVCFRWLSKAAVTARTQRARAALLIRASTQPSTPLKVDG